MRVEVLAREEIEEGRNINGGLRVQTAPFCRGMRSKVVTSRFKNSMLRQTGRRTCPSFA
jgi:hypothetical protein